MPDLRPLVMEDKSEVSPLGVGLEMTKLHVKPILRRIGTLSLTVLTHRLNAWRAGALQNVLSQGLFKLSGFAEVEHEVPPLA